MTNKNQPDRWESVILAAALALAGTLFLFDKLGSFVQASSSFSHSIVHMSPVFLVVIGVSLMLADTTTVSAGNKGKEGRYE